MNYPCLLARTLVILYAGFFLLFALAQGVTERGLQHLVLSAIALVLMITFRNSIILSALAFAAMFAGSVWFFQTHLHPGAFLVVSLPVLVITILFLIGFFAKPRTP